MRRNPSLKKTRSSEKSVKKVPSPQDAERCIEIRKRSKRGEHISPEDHDFCTTMFKIYQKWYAQQSVRIFKETAPYGSY